MKDEAMYQCKASNHLGSAYSTAQLKVLGKMEWCLIFMLLFMNRSFEYLHYVQVCINDMIYLLPYPELAPTFRKKPLESEMYAAEGVSVTIVCNPEAAPRPKFTWRKNDLVIGRGMCTRQTLDGRTK